MKRVHHVSEDRALHTAHRDDRPCDALCGTPPLPTEPDLGDGHCEWCRAFDADPIWNGVEEALQQADLEKR